MSEETPAGGRVKAGRPPTHEPDPPELFMPTSNPAPGLHEIVSGKPLPSFAELRAKYPEHDAPEVDFRAALKNDGHAWGTKSRLEALLGRPYLATQLVDQLDPEVSTRLAYRLQELFTVELERAMHAVNLEVEAQVQAKIAQFETERVERAEGVRRERFGSPNRHG